MLFDHIRTYVSMLYMASKIVTGNYGMNCCKSFELPPANGVTGVMPKLSFSKASPS